MQSNTKTQELNKTAAKALNQLMVAFEDDQNLEAAAKKLTKVLSETPKNEMITTLTVVQTLAVMKNDEYSYDHDHENESYEMELDYFVKLVIADLISKGIAA